ncbi:unnamed protein product [Diatraea saccharalis]|uniref:Down syndrome cell adhesion molecule-like protein Dscam2 n=1 Tax=Diatraea saccharalis TaxID=40085 RepID=A0A9N9RH56_9NEOP|nr:unnamed protein product [Diatraea saccharalis]
MSVSVRVVLWRSAGGRAGARALRRGVGAGGARVVAAPAPARPAPAGVVNDLEGQVETRRAGGTETVLQALQSGTNYSISVRARTAAGPGPVSDPVSCVTLEDIPGPPADVKALAHSDQSVIVSWLPPERRNGNIDHYTVYTRPQRGGQQSQVMVRASGARQGAAEGQRELQTEVTGLREHAVYEFWVTATSAAGEGDTSAVLTTAPHARAPAAIWSFGGVVRAVCGRALRLRCGAAGGHVTRVWARRRPAPPLQADPRYLLDGEYLVILNVDRSVADNYTCAARNALGAGRAAWEVRAACAPPPPRLRLAHAAPAALALVWDSTVGPIKGYTLEHGRAEGGAEGGAWARTRLAADARGHTLRRLACGAVYRVRLSAYNAAGASPPSEELLVSTKGGPSRAAPEKTLIMTNSSCVNLNLLTWDSNGCPLFPFVVSVRGFEETSWRSKTVGPAIQPTSICDLQPATWYHLKIVATTAAGTTLGNYYFATLTEEGGKVLRIVVSLS